VGDEAQQRVKLYLDHDISYRIAEQLRAWGYDVIGAWEVGNAELLDQAQLEYAAHEARVLVTCNAGFCTALPRVVERRPTSQWGGDFGAVGVR